MSVFNRTAGLSFSNRVALLGARAPAILISLFCFATPNLSQAAERDDVAIHGQTGETFIVQSTHNPDGELVLLKDSDAAFEERLQLLPGATSEALFEVEMTPQGDPAYLVQSGDRWMIGKLRKTAGKWLPMHPLEALHGNGFARGLTALPDGNLAVTVRNTETTDDSPEVLLVTSELAVAERISEAKLEAKASELITQEAKLESGSGMGFAAGALSGVGIAYRRHFANKWGIQIAGIALGDATSLMANLGLNLMRTLSRSQRVRFYALMGVSTFYQGQQGVTYPEFGTPGCNDTDPTCAGTQVGWENSVLLNFGAGIGMEFELTKNLGLALELPIDVMLNFGRNQPLLNGVYPIPSGSLIYYF